MSWLLRETRGNLNPMLRLLGLTAGFIALGLSLVSFVVPVLPTVPLLILTCFLFSKSSPRWHSWLLNNRRLGPPLRSWDEHGVIETRVKVTTTAIMSLFLSYPLLFGDFPGAVRLWIAACALGIFLFMWTRPSTPA